MRPHGNAAAGRRGRHDGSWKAHPAGHPWGDVLRLFPDDPAAEAWFVAQRWPDGVRCAHCDSANVQTEAKHPTMPCRCRACHRYFSVKTGTAMAGSNLGYQTWALAIYALTTSLKGVSSMKLHRDLGITQTSAWYLAHRLREAWAARAGPFDGPVEADETYIGGREKNRSPARKRRLGRGAVGKAIVAGVKDRPSNRVQARVVLATDRRTLTGFVGRHTTPAATIYTDDHPAYRGLLHHQTIRHSAGEYVRGAAHTNGIEAFWALFKRGDYGTYHQMSPKHLPRYVAEFAGRHNARPLDTIDQMRAIVRGLVGKRLRYRTLVA